MEKNKLTFMCTTDYKDTAVDTEKSFFIYVNGPSDNISPPSTADGVDFLAIELVMRAHLQTEFATDGSSLFHTRRNSHGYWLVNEKHTVEELVELVRDLLTLYPVQIVWMNRSVWDGVMEVLLTQEDLW